jgi:O-glycosyl hydrolase
MAAATVAVVTSVAVVVGATPASAATTGAITGYGGKCVDVAAANSANRDRTLMTAAQNNTHRRAMSRIFVAATPFSLQWRTESVRHCSVFAGFGVRPRPGRTA